MLGKAERQMRAPLALLAHGFEAWGFVKLNAGLERVDGETDRSKQSAELAVEIEKTQMQARRRRNPNAFQLRASLHDQSAGFRLVRFPRDIAKLCALCQAPPLEPRSIARRETGVLPDALWTASVNGTAEYCGRRGKMAQSPREATIRVMVKAGRR